MRAACALALLLLAASVAGDNWAELDAFRTAVMGSTPDLHHP